MNSTGIIRTALIFALCSTLGFLREAAAQGPTLHTANYLGGGVWEQDANWSTTVYPTNGRTRPDGNGNPIPGPNPIYNANINNPTPCTLSIGVQIQTLNVLQGSTLNLVGRINANTGFGNAGLITLNATGNFTGMLRAGGDSTIAPGGEIFMTDSNSNSVTAGAPGRTLTIAAGGRIRGAGNVNAYHGDDVRTYFGVVNHGLIEATQPVNQLRLNLTDDPAFANAVVNDGVLRASGAGVLYISAFTNVPGNVLNQGGTIEATDNGTVRLKLRATVIGGTLATSGNGTIRGDFAGGSGGTFQDVVNNGTMVIGTDENFGLAGTFTNNGTLRLDGPANISTALFMRGTSVTLAGSGVYAMNGGTTGAGIAGGDHPGQTMTVASGVTIRGKGVIGTNNSNFSYKALNLVNQGLIDATGPLTIWAESASNSNLTNNGGTLRASNGGVLNLNGSGVGSVLNSGGTVEALADSTVRVNNLVTLEGGTVTTSGTGTIRGGNGSGGTLKNVTNSGTVAIGPDEFLHLAGTFTNNALVRFEGTSAQAGPTLRMHEDVTLSGPGVFAMDSPRSAITGAYFTASGKNMTVAPGVTIRGNGSIGTGNANFAWGLGIVNQGLIEAVNSILIFLDKNQGWNVTNNGGTLRAAPGGTLRFTYPGTVTNNAGGFVEVLSNSTVQLDGGATLINNAGGTIRLENGTLNAADGVDLNGGQLIGSGTITGPIRNNGGIVAPGFSPGKITINGNYTQGADGVLNIEIGGAEPGTGYDQLRVVGTATLGGTLNLKLINGFQPRLGDVFEIIDPNAVSGEFAQINAEGFGVQANYAAGAITVTITSVPDRLLNISTRLRVGTGENALIGGFIITGTEAKKVIVRGIGPSLASQGVGGVLENPTLELFDGAGEPIAFNNNWKDDQQGEIEESTIPPGNDLEAAIVRTLEPGNYTAVVRGQGDTTGIGLVEVYDLGAAAQSKLANISSRGFVEAGENVMIGGFIVGGGGEGTRVVVRALGPSLADRGVEGALQDPTLQLVDANGSEIRANDNWRDSQQAELEALSIQPANDAEAALIAALGAGNYTAIVSGKDGGTGVGLVEVYNVQ